MKKTLIIILIVLPLVTKEGEPKKERNVFDRYLYAGLEQFKRIMAFRESSNNPDTTSLNGYYRGLYQFGMAAAEEVHVNYDSLFIPRHSDTALVRYMRINRTRLSNYYGYIGGTINGVKITEAGILAAAHLRGSESVRLYLIYNGTVNKRDLNGTSVEDYMRMMQNVELIKY